MGNNDAVKELLDKAKKFLERNENPDGASAVLYVLTLVACYVGRNNLEEAKTLKSGWAELKGRIQLLAEASEFMSSGRMIDDSIDQVLSPEEYSTPHRDVSSLADNKEMLLGYFQM